jgi:orotate phosphoribosyltransferase
MTQLSEKEIIKLFEDNDACWFHSGDPKDPHAKLTSGLCSNAYFNCSNILNDPEINDILATNLHRKLIEAGIEDNPPDYILGSAYAGITISYELARKMGARHVFAEKSCIKLKEFVFGRWTLPEGSVVLQAEDLITSMHTAFAVRKAVEHQNKFAIEFLPIIAAIVFRPPDLSWKYSYGNQEIDVISLIKKEVWAVCPDQCELCKKGSILYSPKYNWEVLNKRA